MELHQLRMFVAVAEEGSFTRAADRLHVVQSAVSSGIRTLERELGTRLFDRNTRQVSLSDAGHALLPEARRVLDAVTHAYDAVQQVDSGVRGSVTLGVMQAQAMRALSVARLLAEFGAHYPAVQVTVRHVGGSREAGRHVREGQLDLAFLSFPDPDAPGLALTPLTSETMLIACAPGHPLAERADVDFTEIAEEPFVELPVGWGTRMASDQAFTAANVRRTVAFEVNDSESLVEFVREGLAIALIPPSLAAHAPDLALIPLRRGAPSFDTFLAEPLDRRPTAATRALVATIRRLAQAESPGRST